MQEIDSYTLAALIHEELRVHLLMNGDDIIRDFHKRWRERSAADQAAWENAVRVALSRMGLFGDRPLVLGYVLSVPRESGATK
jgi:hypothetical protein